MHADTTPLMTARDVTKRFDDTEVLRGVSFDIGRAQKKVVIGPSGSGKSTLLRCLALLERADAGEIRLEGEEVGFKQVRGRRVHQSGAIWPHRCDLDGSRLTLFPHLPVDSALGPTRVRCSSRRGSAAAAAAARVVLAHASAPTRAISGGHQQGSRSLARWREADADVLRRANRVYPDLSGGWGGGGSVAEEGITWWS